METFGLPSKLERRAQVREALRRAYGAVPKGAGEATEALLEELRRLEEKAKSSS